MTVAYNTTACHHSNAACTYHTAFTTNPTFHNKYATLPNMLPIYSTFTYSDTGKPNNGSTHCCIHTLPSSYQHSCQNGLSTAPWPQPAANCPFSDICTTT